MKKKRYVGYARTSLKEEKIENQIRAIREKYSDILIFDNDRGVSGIVPAKQRKGFSELMEYMEQHTIEGIVVYELSRIGRSFIETLNLVTELEQRGIKVISVSPNESWTTMENKELRQFMTMIFTWVAGMERKNLIERTKQGIERARDEGKRIGRPEREINWKEFDKWQRKNIPIKSIAKIMEIPYPTLYSKVQERNE